MNTTALIGGVTSSDFDGNLMEQLDLHFVKISTVREKYLVIAIGNQNGEIYRIIGVDSQEDLAILLKALRCLNLSCAPVAIAHLGSKYHMVLSRPGTVAAPVGVRLRKVGRRHGTL